MAVPPSYDQRRLASGAEFSCNPCDGPRTLSCPQFAAWESVTDHKDKNHYQTNERFCPTCGGCRTQRRPRSTCDLRSSRQLLLEDIRHRCCLALLTAFSGV